MKSLRAMHVLRLCFWACAVFSGLNAQAALFGDDEARKAILELRERMDTFAAAQARQSDKLADDNAQLRRGMLELQSQIDALRADMARMRGQEEQLARDLSELQRRQKDISQGVDERLRKFEPVKVSLDGREFLVEPAEKDGYEAAWAVFRSGDFAAAQTSLASFARRYPSSGYIPSVLFWLGNAQYATRDYKESIINFRAMLAQAPGHARAPEAALSIANCQIELKDTKAARRTLEELVKAYPQAEAAQAARERLAKLR